MSEISLWARYIRERSRGWRTSGPLWISTESVRGLAHNKYLKTRPEAGDTIFVTVRNILPNGNIELEPAELKEYNTVEVEKELPLSKAADLQSQVGKTIMIKGEVIQVKQTGGPTIFTVADDSGIVFCAAFERAGVRAYAEIDSEMMVRVIGEVTLRNNQVQIEIKSMKRLWGGEASRVKDQIEQAIDRRAEPSETQLPGRERDHDPSAASHEGRGQGDSQCHPQVPAHCGPPSCRCRRHHGCCGHRDGHTASHKGGGRS